MPTNQDIELPYVLTRSEFENVRQKYIDSAPDGLSREAFSQGLEEALRDEERYRALENSTVAKAELQEYGQPQPQIQAPPNPRKFERFSPITGPMDVGLGPSFTPDTIAAVSRVAPIAVAAIPGVGLPAAAVAGGLGEIGAQAAEQYTGDRPDFNWKQVGVQAGLSAVPELPGVRSLGPAGRFVAHTATGTALGTAGAALYGLAGGQRPSMEDLFPTDLSWSELAKPAALGTIMGAGSGAVSAITGNPGLRIQREEPPVTPAGEATIHPPSEGGAVAGEVVPPAATLGREYGEGWTPVTDPNATFDGQPITHVRMRGNPEIITADGTMHILNQDGTHQSGRPEPPPEKPALEASTPLDVPRGNYSIAALAGPALAAYPGKFSDDPDQDHLIRAALLGASAMGVLHTVSPAAFRELGALAKSIALREKITEPSVLAERLAQEVGPEAAAAHTTQGYGVISASEQAATKQPLLFSNLESALTQMRTSAAKGTPDALAQQLFKGKPKVWTAGKAISFLKGSKAWAEAQDNGLAAWLEAKKPTDPVTRQELFDQFQQGVRLTTKHSADQAQWGAEATPATPTLTKYSESMLRSYMSDLPPGARETNYKEFALQAIPPETDSAALARLAAAGLEPAPAVPGMGDYPHYRRLGTAPDPTGADVIAYSDLTPAERAAAETYVGALQAYNDHNFTNPEGNTVAHTRMRSVAEALPPPTIPGIAEPLSPTQLRASMQETLRAWNRGDTGILDKDVNHARNIIDALDNNELNAAYLEYAKMATEDFTGNAAADAYWQRVRDDADFRKRIYAPTPTRKVQLAEEVQSTAHQDAGNAAKRLGLTGPEAGYRTSVNEAFDRLDQQLEDVKQRALRKVDTTDLPEPRSPEGSYTSPFATLDQINQGLVTLARKGDTEARDLSLEMGRIRMKMDAIRYKIEAKAAPDWFPMKNQDEWSRALAKANVVEALRSGADAIAVPQGPEVAERFGQEALAHQADQLTWSPSTEQLTAYKNGQEVHTFDAVDQKKLYQMVPPKVADELASKALEAGAPKTIATHVELQPGGVVRFTTADGQGYNIELPRGGPNEGYNLEQLLAPLQNPGARDVIYDALNYNEPELSTPVDVTALIATHIPEENRTVSVDLTTPTDVGRSGMSFYDRMVAPQIQSGLEKLGGGQPVAPLGPGLNLGEMDRPAFAVPKAPLAERAGQPMYGKFESEPELNQRLLEEGIGAKRALRDEFPGMPFTSEYGKADPAFLSRLGGAAAGAVAGYATGDDETGNRLLNAGLGAVAGAFVGGMLHAAALKATARNVAQAERLARYPDVKLRLEPNSARNQTLLSYRDAARILKEDLGEKLIPYHGLKTSRHELTGAIDTMKQYHNARFAIPETVMREIKGVLAPVREPADYTDFFHVVRLRRDLEGLRNATADWQARIAQEQQGVAQGLKGAQERLDDLLTAQPKMEAGMDPAQAQAYLAEVEQGITPAVQEAIDNHYALVRKIGQMLVRRGVISPETAARNQDYLFDWVLNHATSTGLVGSPAPPLRKPRAGYAKQRMGGERATVRDYVQVMSHYLADVAQDELKDMTITRFARDFDPRQTGEIPPDAEHIPPGYEAYKWPLTGHDPKTYWLPDDLVRYLKTNISQPSKAFQAYQRLVNNRLKSVIIRGTGLPYHENNIIGDLGNLVTDVRISELKDIPGEMLNAFKGTWDYLHAVDPSTLSPQDRVLYDMAERGQREGIGTAAAIADVQEQVFRDPHLRQLTADPNASLLTKMRRGAADTASDVMALVDAFAQYRENIPRLALMMHEIMHGRPQNGARLAARSSGDYTDLTTFEMRYFRGLLFPFYSWARKMADNWIPLLEGPGTLKERFHKDLSRGDSPWSNFELSPYGKITKVMAVSALLTYWNEVMFPNAESQLPDWERNRLHILIPHGFDEHGHPKVLSLGLSGAANAVAGYLGLQGMAPRLTDLAKGRTTVGEFVGESGKQVRQNWVGLLTPAITLPLALITGQDPRTGRNFYNEWDPAFNTTSTLMGHQLPTVMGHQLEVPTLDQSGTKLSKMGKVAIGSLPPMTAAFAAARDAGTPDETFTEFMKRMLAGSFVKEHVPAHEVSTKLMRTFAEGKQRGQAMYKQARQQVIEPMKASLSLMGPWAAVGLYVNMGNSRAMEMPKSMLVDAVQELASENRAWQETAKYLQLLQQHPAWYEQLAIADQMRRKIVPKSPNELAREAEGRAQQR